MSREGVYDCGDIAGYFVMTAGMAVGFSAFCGFGIAVLVSGDSGDSKEASHGAAIGATVGASLYVLAHCFMLYLINLEQCGPAVSELAGPCVQPISFWNKMIGVCFPEGAAVEVADEPQEPQEIRRPLVKAARASDYGAARKAPASAVADDDADDEGAGAAAAATSDVMRAGRRVGK